MPSLTRHSGLYPESSRDESISQVSSFNLYLSTTQPSIPVLLPRHTVWGAESSPMAFGSPRDNPLEKKTAKGWLALVVWEVSH